MTDQKPAMFYFGPLGDLGHYFYSEEGGRIYDYPHPDVPWKEVDGGLCAGSVPGDSYSRSCPEVVGKALLHHKDGWTALSFWDRTIDTRPGSNSNYFAEGIFTFEQMVEMAKTRFAHRWNKMKFEVVLCKPEKK